MKPIRRYLNCCNYGVWLAAYVDSKITDYQQFTHATSTGTPPYHNPSWLLDLTLIRAWMVLLLFDPDNIMPRFKYLKGWLVGPQKTFPAFHCPSQMRPSPEKSLTTLDLRWCMASLSLKLYTDPGRCLRQWCLRDRRSCVFRNVLSLAISMGFLEFPDDIVENVI